MTAAPDPPIFSDTDAWEAVQAALEEAELGDGLPLVPPTPGRLDAMLAGAGPPERSYGQVPPLFGDLTTAATAYQCVLAGCRPGELAVVLAAVTACLEADFNLLGILTTTGTPAVAVVVHGPTGRRFGVNAGTNCLGPGARANACIGRAVSLVLRNVGGARPGVGDMATMGQPGKYTFCFAEHAQSLLPPLHVRRGLEPGASAVTVLGVSGTLEVLPAGDGDSPEAVLAPVATAMRAAGEAGGGRRPRSGEQVFLLPPELVDRLGQWRWDLRRLQTYLFHEAGGAAVVPGPDAVEPIVTGGPGVKMTYLPLWAGGTRPITRAFDLPD